jgi:hypothetical protein
VAQLGSADETIPVLVENLRGKKEVAATVRLELGETLGIPPSVPHERTLKASLISSALSVSFILRAIMVRNSGGPRGERG